MSVSLVQSQSNCIMMKVLNTLKKLLVSDDMSFLNKMTVSTIDATISAARIRDKTRIKIWEESSSGASASVKSTRNKIYFKLHEIKVLLLK